MLLFLPWFKNHNHRFTQNKLAYNKIKNVSNQIHILESSNTDMITLPLYESWFNKTLI